MDPGKRMALPTFNIACSLKWLLQILLLSTRLSISFKYDFRFYVGALIAIDSA
jgi:hypothetical protein